MVQSDLLKWNGRILKRIESPLVLFLKYGRKTEKLQPAKVFECFPTFLENG